MTLVDVHCHLDAPAYRDLTAVCQQSRQAGVTVTVAAGTGLQSNARILALQEQEPGQVWAALGLHPERLDASWEELEAVIAQIQEHRARVVALGEIGLPHYALLDNRMTPAQAQEAHAFIRQTLTNLSDEATAEKIRIQYGGSVKPDNARRLMSQPDIDGALVGGASLDPRIFAQIVKAARAEE